MAVSWATTPPLDSATRWATARTNVRYASSSSGAFASKRETAAASAVRVSSATLVGEDISPNPVPRIAASSRTSRGIPATNAGLANVELDAASQAVIDYEASVEQYLTTPPPAPPAATGAIEVKFGELYQQVQYAEMTPAEAAELFFTEAETLLANEQ